MAADADTTPAGVAKSPNLVTEHLDAHPEWVSDEVEATARALARRAELEHPINRAPSTVAAAAIYLVGLLGNEKLTQREVSDASGVSAAAIREGYIELCKHEGYHHPRHDDDEPADNRDAGQRSSGFINRVRTWVGRRD